VAGNDRAQGAGHLVLHRLAQAGSGTHAKALSRAVVSSARVRIRSAAGIARLRATDWPDHMA
jgi:hypothetical protein